MGRGGGWRWSCAGRARFPWLSFLFLLPELPLARRDALRCDANGVVLGWRAGEERGRRDGGLVRGGIINQRLPEKQNN